ncbi:uncharacterized protein LOC131938500 [Physella acuta]|uniref:uncharacterized protein LOC131938500 n=1 Tax=Physella acuta TaxID=109671 RepID=UPI0027DE86EF|nr:uncharacterized protein LOC131938500 [Physella acuta]
MEPIVASSSVSPNKQVPPVLVSNLVGLTDCEKHVCLKNDSFNNENQNEVNKMKVESGNPLVEAVSSNVNNTFAKPFLIKGKNSGDTLNRQPSASNCGIDDLHSEIKEAKAEVLSAGTDEEKAYESEPACLEKLAMRKKLRNRIFRGKQSKTVYPRTRAVSKEMRELSRKHAMLEKNLKIEGLPDPPKFRKRRLSLSSNMGRPHDKDLMYKRKRLASVDSRPRRDHMPKWELMGGDAHDPLNLNGLAHSEEGRLLNLKTPESSPLPTPDFRKIVYVKVPPNIEDPLNLEGKHDQKVIDMLLNSTIKKRHRSRKKKHDEMQVANSSSGPTATTPVMQTCAVMDPNIPSEEESVSQNASATQNDISPLKNKTSEPPTPPKPSISNTSNNRSRSRSLSMSPERKFKRQTSGSRGKSGPNEPTKFPAKPMFTLGNYNRYYGYRNRDHEPDPRLQYFDPSWFKGKDVLDIGCNTGHITLALAEQFYPHKILGMDIDGKLIQAARQNIRHMLSQRRKDSSKYPCVFEMTKGPLEAHPLMGSSDQFPNNVLFLQGNYVPGSEEILKLQKEEYDIILALSITKWIHLNNGDDGLKLFFQKIFRQLRPGGRLILEPQPWSTYRKRAKLSAELFAKYQSIKLKPEGFKHYLLSIGFVKCEVIGVPVTKAKGFRRPLILFTKADNKQAAAVPESEAMDYSEVCQECGNKNKSECEHPQFTGMRRGPYASQLYDHINYPPSSDSPYRSAQRNGLSSSLSFTMPPGDDIGSSAMDRSERVDAASENGVTNFVSESWRGSVREASRSGSRSSSSSMSRSGFSLSSSGTSGSSSTVSSSSYYTPSPAGLNGDIVSGSEYSPSVNGQVVDSSPSLIEPSVESSPNLIGQNFDSSPVLIGQNDNSSPIMIEPIDGSPSLIESNVDCSPIMIGEDVNSSPIMIEPIVDGSPILIGQNNSSPIMIEPIDDSPILIGQNDNSSPLMIEPSDDVSPILIGQNDNSSPIVGGSPSLIEQEVDGSPTLIVQIDSGSAILIGQNVNDNFNIIDPIVDGSDSVEPSMDGNSNLIEPSMDSASIVIGPSIDSSSNTEPSVESICSNLNEPIVASNLVQHSVDGSNCSNESNVDSCSNLIGPVTEQDEAGLNSSEHTLDPGASPVVPEASPVVTETSPVPEASPVVPEISPVPEASPVVPETSPVPEASPVVPETSPVPEASPVVPETSPVPEASPVVPETSPVPEASPVVPETSPVPEASPVVPETSPVPEASPVVPEISPVPEATPVVPEASPVVTETSPVPEASPVVPDTSPVGLAASEDNAWALEDGSSEVASVEEGEGHPEVNGNTSVVQHWDMDNQDANIDVPVRQVWGGDGASGAGL